MSKLTKAEIEAIEARMRELPDPDLTDPDNPEWTEEDFARAVAPEVLPAAELAVLLAAFPRTAARLRGRPRLDRPKIAVKLRLDQDVIDAFKAEGPGWQTRINEALRKVLGPT